MLKKLFLNKLVCLLFFSLFSNNVYSDSNNKFETDTQDKENYLKEKIHRIDGLNESTFKDQITSMVKNDFVFDKKLTDIFRLHALKMAYSELQSKGINTVTLDIFIDTYQKSFHEK